MLKIASDVKVNFHFLTLFWGDSEHILKSETMATPGLECSGEFIMMDFWHVSALGFKWFFLWKEENYTDKKKYQGEANSLTSQNVQEFLC